MRKVYLLMAVAAIVMVGCKNNGSKKAQAAEEDAIERAENAMEAAIEAVDADQDERNEKKHRGITHAELLGNGERNGTEPGGAGKEI